MPQLEDRAESAAWERGKLLADIRIDVAASLATFNDRAGFTQHYNGVGMWKTADDLTRYEQVITATRPELVIETGTRWGGFAHWLADRHGLDVLTIDIRGTVHDRVFPRVTSLVGSSVDERIVETATETARGRPTMVVLDSDHHAPHVAAEIRAYGPLVTPGCYLVVEDALADLAAGDEARRFGNQIPELGGPLAAIEETLAGAACWARDLEVENLTRVSHHPAGWWVRRE
jgi:cephalosporin hydroxylase